MQKEEEARKYLDMICSDVTGGRLDEYASIIASGGIHEGGTYVASNAVEYRFKRNFFDRLFCHEGYMNMVIEQVINERFTRFESGVSDFDRGMEFCVLKLYAQKMKQEKKEPFPSDRVLFLYRFFYTLTRHPELQMIVQRIVPESKWLPVFGYLEKGQKALLESNYTEDNAFTYVVLYVLCACITNETEEDYIALSLLSKNIPHCSRPRITD